MKREEQIKNYAINNCIQDDIDDTSYELIINAAKWADDTMLDKACKWLKENLSEGSDPDNYPMIRCYDITLEDFIEEFRREMEK